MAIINFSPIFTKGLDKLEKVKDLETLKIMVSKLKELESELEKLDKLTMEEILKIEGFEGIRDEGIVYSFEDLRLIGMLKESEGEILFLGIITLENLMNKFVEGKEMKN